MGEVIPKKTGICQMNIKLDKPTEQMLVLIAKAQRKTQDKVVEDFIKNEYARMKK
jgi:hypothetical protein